MRAQTGTPSSLFLDPPLVADFGIASMKAGTRRTTQSKAGTPGFQSPEQLNGLNIGPHCDVYAFGCIVLELFTEKPIWEGLSAHAIMFRVGVKNEFPPITCSQPEVNPVMMSCFKEVFKKQDDIVTSIVKNIRGKGGLLINTVEQDWFREFMRLMEPRFQQVSRVAISARLDILYEEEKRNLLSEIEASSVDKQQ